MSGNVWEWVADWYDQNYYKLLNDENLQNPKGPTDGQQRVMRGGSFNSYDAVSTYVRAPKDPTESSAGLGFRCAYSITP